MTAVSRAYSKQPGVTSSKKQDLISLIPRMVNLGIARLYYGS